MFLRQPAYSEPGVALGSAQKTCFSVRLSSMLLRPAHPEDIPALIALERLPESARFVGQWSEERHQAALLSSDARSFVSDAESPRVDPPDPKPAPRLRDSSRPRQNLRLDRAEAPCRSSARPRPRPSDPHRAPRH